MNFVHADPNEYTCFFTGSGVTAGMNRMARVFSQIRPDRNIVLVSIMERKRDDLTKAMSNLLKAIKQAD